MPEFLIFFIVMYRAIIKGRSNLTGVTVPLPSMSAGVGMPSCNEDPHGHDIDRSIATSN